MERRLRVVPFNNRPAQKDDKLKEKLSAEYPAILRWILDGCLAWQVRGLGTCQAIAAASSAYFDAQGNFSQWIADRCEVGDKEKARKTALLEDFNAWLRARAEKPMDSRSFKEALERRPGCYGRHTRDGSTIFGLSLRPNTLMGVEALMA